MYDFGARMQDMQLGRWWQVDPLAEKYYNKNPYNYCGNNPVFYIDPYGQYELPAPVQKSYPAFTSYIKNNIEKDVMKSSVILKAFAKNTAADNPNGVGNLTKEKVQETVSWGSGPMIVVKDKPGGMEGANGFYNNQTGQIELSKDRMASLEKMLSSDASDEDKFKALSAVFMTVLHETTQYGDYLDGGRQDGGEPGDAFEFDVWQGKDVTTEDGQKIKVRTYNANPDN
jgi:hypothetical protein